MPDDESYDVQYVLDGGSLLQCLRSDKGMSFNAICQLYIDYINRRYAQPTVIFDGYSTTTSTKHAAHLRRSKGIISPDVTFTADMIFKSKKDVFLTNTNNKDRFITLLSQRLKDNGCTVINARKTQTVLLSQQQLHMLGPQRSSSLARILTFLFSFATMHPMTVTAFSSSLRSPVSADNGISRKQNKYLVTTSANFYQ